MNWPRLRIDCRVVVFLGMLLVAVVAAAIWVVLRLYDAVEQTIAPQQSASEEYWGVTEIRVGSPQSDGSGATGLGSDETGMTGVDA